MSRKTVTVDVIGASQYATLIAPDTTLATLTGNEVLENKELTSPVINNPTGITQTDVGLSAVDNTADVDKPISSAVGVVIDSLSAAIDTKFTAGEPLSAAEVYVEHLISSGALPSISAGDGITTASVSGSDGAGAIEFTVDVTPVTGVDAFVTHVEFAQAYTTTPFVLISPANESAAVVGFTPHVVATEDGFDIMSNQTLPFTAGATFVYNYMVVQ